MSDGIGCKCHASCWAECCCDADWTPQEVYDLREQLAAAEQRVKEAQEELRLCQQDAITLQAKCADLERERDHQIDLRNQTIDDLRAELAALKTQAGVPDGWKMVPIEPTSEMLKAAYSAYEEGDISGPYGLYKAMLSAAPTPTTEAQGDGTKCG